MRALFLSAFLFLTAITHAQVVDNFSDSNFTATPAWAGDDSLFIINSNKELQSNGPQATSTLSLSTPNSLIDSVEWNFLVKLAFNPSSTNYVRVYLVSDNADLKGSLNGYFFQLGEAGTAPDSIDIFRQNGNTLTKVFTGISGCLSSSSGDSVRIKITRDNTGNWSVYADCAGGTNYNLEGQFTDNSFTATAHFGFYCRYSTVSRYNMYFFDDISIATISIVGDTMKPAVQTVNIISSTQLDVKFSEAVNALTAENISNYSIDNSIGNPLSAQIDSIDNSLVHLTLSSPLASGTPYNITIQNVDDLAGNVMLPATLPLFYLTPVKGDIVINEIFADFAPQVNLPNGEFVELKNNKSFPVNLTGWTFSDATSAVTLPNVSVPADSFIVLCATSLVDSFAVRGFNNIIVAGLSSLPSLNNTSDSLTLIDNSGNIIDVVVYSDSWYRDAVKQDGGWTLERIDANTSCGEAENWIASVNINGGTPGTKNSIDGTIFDTIKPEIIAYEVFSSNSVKITLSENIDSLQLLVLTNYSLNNGLGNPQSISVSGLNVILTFSSNLDSSLVYILTIQNLSDCSGNTMLTASLQIIFYTPAVGDIVINEIFPDQAPQINLPNGEFIELKNNKNIPVNLNGWTFSDASTTVTITNIIIPADSFIVLCANSLVDSFAARGFTNIFIKGIPLPSLNNDTDSLTLKDYNGNIIDRVNYSDAWYGDAVKQDGGWSLERIDPNTSCGEGLNWTASVNLNGGTPGTRNSVQGVFSDTTKPFIVSYEIIDSVTLKIIFSESVDATQSAVASNYNINNGGNPQSVSASGLEAILIFGSALDSSLTYQLTAQNIFDCIGNTISSSPTIISFPSKADVYDVLITEIYADPEPSYGLPNAEYVELFNRSDKTISLKDWTFSDVTSTSTLPDKILMPENYIIVCANSNEALFASFGNVATVNSLPSLNNDSDELTLKDALGKTIHYVNYSSDWYSDAIKKDGGFSLEMMDTENPCTGAGNWKASEATIGGTPGTENSVNGINPDNEMPSLLYVLVSDSQHIALVFEESLDSLSITNLNQFSIRPNDVAAITFTAIAPSFSEIHLTLNSPLQPKIIYTITVSNITDCSGYIIEGNTAQFGLPEFPDSGDVIINEILFNPESFGSDFVELYNNSDKIIDLKSLIIAEADYVKRDSVTEFIRASERGFLLLPQQYVALTSDANYIRSRYFSENPKNILLLSALPSYPDDEGVVMLKDSLLNTLDKVAYSEDWHYPFVDDKNGVSLERIQFNVASQDKNNWHSAASTAGYATPAYKNSQYKDAAEVKEYFTISPEAFSPDNDGYNDFLNIIYQFDEPGWAANIKIFDSGGRPIRDLLKNELLATDGTLQWDGITDEGKKARIGIHIIYIELFNPDGDVKKYKKSCVVAGKIE